MRGTDSFRNREQIVRKASGLLPVRCDRPGAPVIWQVREALVSMAQAVADEVDTPWNMSDIHNLMREDTIPPAGMCCVEVLALQDIS